MSHSMHKQQSPEHPSTTVPSEPSHPVAPDCYVKPSLVCYGTIADLTRGGGWSGPDDPGIPFGNSRTPT